jgi:hypothetical protein
MKNLNLPVVLLRNAKSVSILAALCSCCLLASSAVAHCKLHFHFAYMGIDNQQEATFQVACRPILMATDTPTSRSRSPCRRIFTFIMGTGTGKFDPPVIYLADGYVQSIVPGDFNNDGKPDLVEAMPGCCGGTGVHSFLNDGSGGFLPSVSFSAGADPGQVVTADFNHDGNLDLAVPDWGTGNVLVLLGDGHGRFRSADLIAIDRRLSRGG